MWAGGRRRVPRYPDCPKGPEERWQVARADEGIQGEDVLTSGELNHSTFNTGTPNQDTSSCISYVSTNRQGANVTCAGAQVRWLRKRLLPFGVIPSTGKECLQERKIHNLETKQHRLRLLSGLVGSW